MPELPEVETIRLKLEPHLVGRRFDHVEIGDPRLVRPFEPGAVAAELEGERVSALERRGKYLIVRFESGRALLIHLRMTGSLRHAAKGNLADDPHRRAVVKLDDGSNVAYRDVRRGLGYSEGSIAVVYASHMLEHLYRDEALRFLQDAHRALMPEGVCRIVVPDLIISALSAPAAANRSRLAASRAATC